MEILDNWTLKTRVKSRIVIVSKALAKGSINNHTFCVRTSERRRATIGQLCSDNLADDGQMSLINSSSFTRHQAQLAVRRHQYQTTNDSLDIVLNMGYASNFSTSFLPYLSYKELSTPSSSFNPHLSKLLLSPYSKPPRHPSIHLYPPHLTIGSSATTPPPSQPQSYSSSYSH